ncbi:hypothetical protein [Bradyrhizobium sp.]|uniref:hypothetical protein n=1 Tax=Bradyrhizobium sp. TaxID=376 RepID=UPI002387E9E9|nr:hypothetical protein [Bradyrhizobium sp.]MDE2380417.1 hypothetical protein [Bradyrhizobium sp.]
MAWFINHYECDRCDRRWTDEWSCACDDECPHCGFRDMTPFDSEDLTELIVEESGKFIVLRSPEAAEDDPDYEELGRFSTRDEAKAFLRSYPPD